MAPATVYAVTGGKQGLLHALVDEWTAAPEVDEAYRTIATLEDPRAIIAEVASLTRRMRRDWGDVMRIVWPRLRLTKVQRPHCNWRPCGTGVACGALPSASAYGCARWTPHTRRRPAPKQQIRPVVQRVLDGMTDLPAIVLNGRLDLLAANRLGVTLYSPVYADPSRPVNLERFAFLNPQATALYPNWDDAANTTVAMLRTEAGRNPYDRGLYDLIGELSTRSEHFVLTGADLSYWGTQTRRLLPLRRGRTDSRGTPLHPEPVGSVGARPDRAPRSARRARTARISRRTPPPQSVARLFRPAVLHRMASDTTAYDRCRFSRRSGGTSMTSETISDSGLIRPVVEGVEFDHTINAAGTCGATRPSAR